MKVRIILTVAAALALTGCSAAAAPAPPTPAPTVTVTATAEAAEPIAEADAVEQRYLASVRRQARSLTPDVASDEDLVGLGETSCGGDDEAQRTYRLILTMQLHYTDTEANAIISEADEYLC